MVGRRRDVVDGRQRRNAPCVPAAAVHARCMHVPTVGQRRGGVEEWLAWGQAAGALALSPARWRCAREAAGPGGPRGRRVARLDAPDCLHPVYGTATGGVSAVHPRSTATDATSSYTGRPWGRHVDVPDCEHARA
jgi:hypothetical protein